MRKFTISDIHGCLKSFKALLQKISFSKEDELYILGDCVDRGPNSRGVIDHIWKLQETGYTVHCLIGNHEQMLLYNIEAKDELFGINEVRGYPETLLSFDVTQADQIPEAYVRWMKELKYYIEVDQYILVHAGLSFHTSSPLTDKAEMIWTRYWYDGIDRDWLGDRIVVHGHTPSKQLVIKKSIQQLSTIPAINIDNGCCFKGFGLGNLCALELGTRALTFQGYLDG